MNNLVDKVKLVFRVKDSQILLHYPDSTTRLLARENGVDFVDSNAAFRYSLKFRGEKWRLNIMAG